ncbi:response regulator [Thalassolituus sp. LLYu03]|uniref:response regulator n=1 Tax=Thalassolituus sp. LLYu03 TaxID=3421656 RepID=UPI003D2BD638
MTNKSNSSPVFKLPKKLYVLVVDDDPAVLQVTRLVLSRFQFQGRPVELVEASSGQDAARILQSRSDFAAVLLDVVMESDDAGLKLVEYIRNTLNNFRIRIILRTGQPGYAPERKVVQDYDINDYLMKADATQARLIVAVTTAIRGYLDILRAETFAQQVQVSEQASFAKTQFLAHMSHELRTPLNGVVGIVSLLAETPLNDEQRALISDLSLASDALLGVINDVLDVAKIEAGKLELHTEAFSPTVLIQKVAAVFSAPLRSRGILFSQTFEIPDQMFVGDPLRIQQVLINYLSNAQKFTQDGGRISLQVSVTQKPDGRWNLFAEVEDNGRGIREDRLASIFEAYEQESSGTSAQYGGTGLGLSLSRSLAELMGGSVGADSQVGRGSRFWLSVPLELTSDLRAEAEVNAKALQNKNQEDTVIAGRRVLIAEDDPTSLKVLQHMLSACGAEVGCFTHGVALMESDRLSDADAVILDYYMPLMSGPDCARKLRDQGFNGVIFALTGATTTEELATCYSAGMDDILIKPVSRQQLITQVAAGLAAKLQD